MFYPPDVNVAASNCIEPFCGEMWKVRGTIEFWNLRWRFEFYSIVFARKDRLFCSSAELRDLENETSIVFHN